jgi:septum formation protein
MRGRSGVLRTGHCLIDTGRTDTAADRTVSVVVSTTVHFADITDEEIALYCATGEPTTVAGAFTIDCLGSWFVEGIEGDHHNVIGVSLTAVRGLLRQLGYGLPDLGYGGDW